MRGAPINPVRDNLEAMIEACLRNKARYVGRGMQLPTQLWHSIHAKVSGYYPQLAKRHELKLVPFLLDGYLTNQT